MNKIVDLRFTEYFETLRRFRTECSPQISHFAEELLSIFERRGKLLICGNGGSAADAQHLAAEFVSSFALGIERKSLPVISLSTDTSIITAISNDFGFDLVFKRQVEGLGSPGDGLLAISTSGSSRNCLLAAEKAREIGMKVFSLTRSQSELARVSDVSIAVPSENTQYIQQCHMLAYHTIVEVIENSLVRKE